jgi:hypothetical protein
MYHPPTLIRNPRVPNNLSGLASVALACEIDVEGVAGVRADRLLEVAHRLVTGKGLSVDSASPSRLVMGIATELRPDHAHMIYGVEVVLKERAVLHRDGQRYVDAFVDSWRHQKSTGVIFLPHSEPVIGEALGQEAVRQLLAFLDDWQIHNSS